MKVYMVEIECRGIRFSEKVEYWHPCGSSHLVIPEEEREAQAARQVMERTHCKWHEVKVLGSFSK